MTDTPTEDRLLERLRTALHTTDPVPAAVLAAARAVFERRFPPGEEGRPGLPAG